MPGPVYFAWVDVDVEFDPVAHAVEDEAITELQIQQSEGDFAGLNITVINPGVGLLAPGRKQWCWLSWDNGTDLVPLFYGRLVAVPESIDGETVRLLFAAKPLNYDATKKDYAETLKVLPFYDPIWITGDDEDADAVLNGYGAQWHIDRTTLEVSHSDELTGEDGTLSIGEADHTYDTFSASYGQPPLSRVDLEGTIGWSQTGRGKIDVSGMVYTACSIHHSIYTHPRGGVVSSLTGDGFMNDWPKPGTDFGGGWTVNAETVAFHAPAGWKPYTYDVQFRTLAPEVQNFIEGTSTIEDLPRGDQLANLWLNGGSDYFVRFPVYAIQQFTLFDWAADRKRSEIIRCSMAADIQALLAEPDDEANTTKISISAQDTITEPDAAGLMPVEDTRRASYLNTDRGQQSVQYLMLLGRATLRRRARAIELGCRVPWATGIAVTLRMNASVVDRRLPGGAAFGKIIGYAMHAAANDGFYVDINIGCAIGHGGSVAAAAGEPSYVDNGYVAAGYQYMEGAEVTAPTGDLVYQSLGDFTIDDDGMDLLHFDHRQGVESVSISGGMDEQVAIVSAVSDPVAALGNYPTRLCFQMRPVAGMSFETIFTPSVQPLPIPRLINLEA